jgi:hypothetical protein
MPPALAVVFRVALIFGCLQFIVLAILVLDLLLLLDLRLLLARLDGWLLLLFFLDGQVPRGVPARFRGVATVQVFPKGDALGSLMCVGDL